MKISKNTQYNILIGFIAILIGFIVSSQIKVYSGISGSDNVLVRKMDSLVSILKETKNKNEELQKQIEILKKQIAQLKYNRFAPETQTGKIKEIYEMAGLTPVKGKGIIITIDDRALFDKKKANYENLLHSEDLLKLVNSLKAAGAKSISINDQRLVTTSEIVTADNAIVVNNTKINPPYIIKAIGSTEEMISAINIRGGITEYLEVFGIQLKTEKNNNIIINAYNKEID